MVGSIWTIPNFIGNKEFYCLYLLKFEGHFDRNWVLENEMLYWRYFSYFILFSAYFYEWLLNFIQIKNYELFITICTYWNTSYKLSNKQISKTNSLIFAIHILQDRSNPGLFASWIRSLTNIKICSIWLKYNM